MADTSVRSVDLDDSFLDKELDSQLATLVRHGVCSASFSADGALADVTFFGVGAPSGALPGATPQEEDAPRAQTETELAAQRLLNRGKRAE